MDLPTGTVTFLFTDVEGSTRLVQALGAASYGDVLEAHLQLLREVFRAAGGAEVDSAGDGLFVAFPSAADAVRAAVGAQRSLASHPWPQDADVRVRMGVHTGEASATDSGYRGLSVHRAARICDAANGGQILVSSTTRDVVEADLPADVRLRDLGSAQLPDLDRPEQLFQVVAEGLPDTFPPLRTRSAAPPPDRVDLLERDAELAALDALIVAAPSGGRLLAIEGPAGVGKTRLLAEARGRAQASGMRVLAARGSQLESGFSYGIVRQLFEPLLASASVDERTELLTGAAELATPIFDPAQLAAEPGEDSSLAMLHGLYWLTANLAERRAVLLAIDDLHWCDPSSLRWLAYLLPRLEGLQLLIVVGLRPAEPDAFLRRITTDPLATALRPGALSEEATGELIRRVYSADVEDAFRAAVHEASGGNPLLVRELAYAVAAEGLAPTAANAPRLHDLGGQAVSRAVYLRLSNQTLEATRLARAVAIFGDDTELRDAAALAGLDEASASDAAADLARIEILRRHLPLAFVHPVVRAAVYEAMPAVERDRGHTEAARLLAQSAEPERVAAQLLLSTPRGDEWAVSALRDAAQAAVARGVPESAVAYLRRALDEHPGEKSAEILHELGSAELRASAPEAPEHLAAALAVTTDATARARIALELGTATFSLGQPPKKAVEILQSAIRELPADADSELALELETQLIGIARYDPDLHPLAAERLESLRSALTRISFGRDVVLANLASEATRAGTGSGEAVELAEEALAGGTLMKEHFDPAFIFAAGTLTAADRLDAAARLYGEAIEDARDRGLVIQLWLAAHLRSGVALFRGDLAGAVADAELCLDVLDSSGLDDVLSVGVVAVLAQALIERGEATRARESLASVSAAVEAIESTIPMHISFFDARARLLLAEGEYEQALQEFVSRGRHAEEFGLRNPALFAWRSHAALALVALGRHDDARRYATEELGLSRRWGAPRALGISLIAAALAHGGEEGIALLREAVAVLEPSQARLVHAKALVELGAALRRLNHRSESREPLRQGLELATRCGAALLAERAETELLATGARPRRIALSGVESLTPSERRVAQMAAEGSTNREIAQALFVTTKTVEVHLSSVYRKLDISSRSQLARALAEPGRPEPIASRP